VQNVGSSTYVEGFSVNTTTQVICNSQHINETNVTTTFEEWAPVNPNNDSMSYFSIL